jgi:hypothetical protein
MNNTISHNSQYGIPQTSREWQLADEVENLLIEDAERVCMEQSNRRYKISPEDKLRLVKDYMDLPLSQVLAIINVESYIWRNV